MRLKIIWIGKTRNARLQSLTEDYLARTRRMVSCEIAEARDPARSKKTRGEELRRAEAKHLLKLAEGSNRMVVLDEKGKQFSSPEFARWFESEQNQGTREIAFVIGGPEGVSTTVAERACLILSLGRMTWTHEICRVLLLEQIYRAFGILRNIPYHK